MTLDQLRIFLTVARLQHVTGAARLLNRTQSAVSAAIAALERRHDVVLFNRIGREIELTEDGRRFVPAARAVVEEADRAEALLADFAGTPAGPLRIVASQTVATYWLPARILAFRQAHPAVDPELVTLNTASAVDRVVGGQAEVGVIEGVVDGMIGAQVLDSHVVGGDRLAVIVAPSHPWADGHPLTAADLARAQWVMREPGSGTRAAFEVALAGHGADPAMLKDALILPSNEACLAALAPGRAATVVSILSADAHIASGRLCVAGFPLPDRSFSAIAHAGRHPSRAARAFLEALGAAS
ncbi:LysR family transcriptional regulator [Chachezhania sediminis]|uniref:LysR family transcriptional regulator n=1 Tax=Chachezhania sediminis TaxID=2599291 RepID=UPI00131C615B|nr:LysR family transcriptional regulator [Chachezhania sediminis]